MNEKSLAAAFLTFATLLVYVFILSALGPEFTRIYMTPGFAIIGGIGVDFAMALNN